MSPKNSNLPFTIPGATVLTNNDQVNPTKHNKALVIAWDQDGEGGKSSMRIILDWLAIGENYQRWLWDSKLGSIKSPSINEILDTMIGSGITHRDHKGIQTKIKELHSFYAKVRDLLSHTRSGILDEEIKNGTIKLPATLAEMSQYWDELRPMMSIRILASRPVTSSSTDRHIPDLIGRRKTNIKVIPARQTKAAANPDDSQVNFGRRESPPSGGRDAPAAAASLVRTAGTKRKSPTQNPELAGFERIIAQNYEHRERVAEARERREQMKLANERRRDKMTRALERRKLKIEKRKVELLEMEVRAKARLLAVEDVYTRFRFVRDLKLLGYSSEQTENFLDKHFAGRGLLKNGALDQLRSL
ncbi:uncharacterized protein PGTG_22617 [Puccinia graminis f. sp. tritici CRL 75-36-700-3]|uniref:Uncharacterized protein n=1 Tax=Puccinia graminis f. sp. tritici (strain CRL 75-36-700-3 / race SCCL) TaxID=418459 RepID=H6QV08_PUCGT|nr:uncharacterized protein PGTG_22617 [Puccinia graminis f. sp. tritici CRL 75-36-700-3]EHS62621.1 hypothetical protein PGTG_22617 [Puccinia graminis f. sp. tritici CRL 75-36-700-3]